MAPERLAASPPERDRLSIVVPIGGRREHLARCLNSVSALQPAPAEVVLVRDGGPPLARTDDWPEDTRVVELARPAGPAAARNAGAAAARGEIVLFLDADVTVPADLLTRIHAAFEDPSVAALIGSYDDDPGDSGFLSRYRNLLHHHVHQRARREASTFWGACGAIRRAVFMDAGGFDERYEVPCIEDIELGYRLTRAGHRILLLPGLRVKHWKRWTFWHMVRTDVLRRGVPWSLLLLRRGSFGNDLNVRPAARVAVAAVWGSALTVVLPGGLLVSPALLGLATLLDLDLYRFFAEREGLAFAAATVPLRWSFHLYSGVAFGVAVVLHALGRGREGEAGSSIRARDRLERHTEAERAV